MHQPSGRMPESIFTEVYSNNKLHLVIGALHESPGADYLLDNNNNKKELRV